MVLNPTHTIYKSRKIEYEWNKEIDYRRVIATEDIYAGDMLLIEHGLYDDITKDNNILLSNILYSKKLWDELYPRNMEYSLDDILNSKNTDNIIDAVVSKLNSNIFKHEQQEGTYYTLLRDGIIFNHLKEPNANYHHIEVPMIEELSTIKIFYFIAYKDIKKGEEICTNYGNDYFKEDTDLEDYNKKDTEIFTKNRNKLLSRIDKYLESPECRDVILNHHFYKKGLVYNQDNNQYISLPAFNKLLKGDEKVDITVKEMNEWIQKEMLNILSFLKTKKKILL
jgi:SET domain-containing protein